MKEGKVTPAKPAANMDYFHDYERKRTAAGLSDSAVAAAARVANSTITRARRGHSHMERRTHALLCEAITKLVHRRARKMQRAGITIAVLESQ